ncbi:MAG: hypothetical protein ACYDDI_11500 [Candidatus Acidiferrales bacterium]
MKKLFASLAVLAIGIPAWAQKIKVHEPAQDQIVRVWTSLGHLTVIQVREPVLSVAAGSQAFRVEWRNNKVFIEPLEANVSTNLFIWTKSGRQNYELEPAGPVADMDFAIDHPAAVNPLNIAVRVDPPADPMKVAAEAMLAGQPVRLENWKPKNNRVQVVVRDLYEGHGHIYIRYELQNQTQKSYAPGTPQVVQLLQVRAPESLIALENTQIGEPLVKRLECLGETQVQVTEQELRSPKLEPGQQTIGVVGVKLPEALKPGTVLKLTFAGDGVGPVTATLVL